MDPSKRVCQAAEADSPARRAKGESADDVLAPVAKALAEARQRALEANSFEGVALAERLGTIAAQLGRLPLIAVVGEFNAGKSTLINRLLGVEALPTDVVPTTARPARLQYGERAVLVLHRRDGRQELRAIEDLLRYAHKGDARVDSLGLADVVSLDVFLPSEPLRTFELLDTPGISDPEQDVENTLRAIEQADAVIWCSMATQAWKDSEVSFWARLPAEVKRTSILAITGADRLNTEEDAARVLRRVQAATGGAFGAVVLTSLEPVHNPDENGSGLASLAQAVAAQVVTRSETLRATRALRAAHAAIAETQVKQEEASAQFRALPDALAAATRELEEAWNRTEKELREALGRAAKDFSAQFGDAVALAGSLVDKDRVTSDQAGMFADTLQLIREGVFPEKEVWRDARCIERYDRIDIEGKHDRLKERTDLIADRAVGEIQAAIEAFATKVQESLVPSLDALSPGHGYSGLQVLLRGKDVLSVVESARHRALGSLGGGGFFRVYSWQREERAPTRRFPTGYELEGLLREGFSFNRASDLCDEHGEEALERLCEEVRVLVEGAKRAAERGQAKQSELRKELEQIASPLMKLEQWTVPGVAA